MLSQKFPDLIIASDQRCLLHLLTVESAEWPLLLLLKLPKVVTESVTSERLVITKAPVLFISISCV
jgi:hypothetical protein